MSALRVEKLPRAFHLKIALAAAKDDLGDFGFSSWKNDPKTVFLAIAQAQGFATGVGQAEAGASRGPTSLGDFGVVGPAPVQVAGESASTYMARLTAWMQGVAYSAGAAPSAPAFPFPPVPLPTSVTSAATQAGLAAGAASVETLVNRLDTPGTWALIDDVIAPKLPWPLNQVVGGAHSLHNCLLANGVKDPQHPTSAEAQSVATCTADYLLRTLFQTLNDPHFRVALDIATGNIPAATVDAARLIAGELTDKIREPGFAQSMKLSRDEVEVVATVINLVAGSPDLLILFATQGLNAFQFPAFYQILGGIIQAAGKNAITDDVGWALVKNATIFAELAKGAGGVQAEVDRIYIAPLKAGIRDLKGERGIMTLLTVFPAIGVVIASLGAAFIAVPKIGASIGSKILAAGNFVEQKTSGFIRFIAQVTGATLPAMPEASLLAEIAQLRLDLEASRKALADERLSALTSRPLATSGAPGGGPPSLPQSSGVPGASPALALAAGGFFVGGPIGAGAGFVLGSLLKK